LEPKVGYLVGKTLLSYRLLIKVCSYLPQIPYTKEQLHYLIPSILLQVVIK